MSTIAVVKLWLKVVTLMGITGILLVTPVLTRLGISQVMGQEETELMSSQDSRINGVLDSTNETLKDGSYFQVHQFQGEAGEAIAIELTSDDFDSYLILLDPEENKIAENDDREASHAKIVITLPVTGTYTVIVTSYQPQESGDYSLRWGIASVAEIQLAEASQLNQQVRKLYEQGRYNEAIPLAERALAIRQQVLGQEHLDVATSLNNLALLYSRQGRYSEAEPLYQQALQMRKKLLGDEHRLVATSLNNLAFLYSRQGRYSETEPLYQQALQMRKKLLGDEHPDVATSLNNLALLYSRQGRYSEAEPLYQQALQMRKKLLGDEHRLVATSLNNLAGLYESQGRYSEAEPLYQQALQMRKKLLGDEHPLVVFSLNNLALLYSRQGRYSEAEPLYQQALQMSKKLLGDEHPDVATSLNNLAFLYKSQGRYSEVEPLYQQALQMRKKLLGDEHPDVATSLNNLALLYSRQGRYSEAEPLYQQALQMRKKLLGDEHPDVATSLNNLAFLYESQGRYSEAEPLYQQALQIYKKLLDDEHPSVATSLNNLAFLYESQGRYSEAEPLYQQALQMRKKLLGDEHPSVATSLNNLAILYWTQNNTTDALNLLAEGLEVEEKGLERNLIAGSDQDKQKYIATISKTTDWAISLHLNNHLNKLPNNQQAARLALTTILRRKGRILDFFANNQQLLRRNLDSESQTLLDELSTTRSQLANLIYHQPPNLSTQDYRNQLSNLSEKADNLEDQLYRRSQPFRQATQPITIEAIQNLIPENAALVELVQYKPYNPQSEDKEESWGKPRYAAYILPAQGDIQAIDLGEVEQIESTLYPFRLFVQNADAPIEQVKQTARLVEQQLMQPVRERLGSTKTILLSPDGSLNLIPFEALVDEQNRYLVENYSFTYLTSGRDLLRLSSELEASEPPVLMGAPLFDTPGEMTAMQPSDNSLSSRAIRGLNPAEWGFKHLPGTAEEVKAIASLFNVEPFLGEQATEGMIKQVNRPYVLHIATHGFFETVLNDSASKEILSENPLLLSGLVLAGVKLGQSGGEDGVLTALEATGLDLWGTQLVVLSACHTGNGDITTGEGIYGLRRAFVIAGAESQLISLWKVNDLATKDLMIEYYQRLKTNQEGRSIALQQIKRQMLEDSKYQHPYYWASFIFSGNWHPMEFPGASY
jgi:CHAT domain-containing protein/tetratricopeptide (TPR) repeat protein